jgi:hypothetical protein
MIVSLGSSKTPKEAQEMQGRHIVWEWLFLSTLILGFVAAGASAQSLAEIAKKEKERRSRVESEGETRVITDRDLRSGSGLPTSRPTTVAAAPGEAAAEGEEGEGEGEGEEGEEDETRTREYWQTRVGDVQKRIDDLEAELNSPEANWGGGIRTDVNPLGQRNLERRQQLEQDLAQARAELRTIQEEARRAGVPVGWVR